MSTSRRSLGRGPQQSPAPAPPAPGEPVERVRATDADISAAPLRHPLDADVVRHLRTRGVLPTDADGPRTP